MKETKNIQRVPEETQGTSRPVAGVCSDAPLTADLTRLWPSAAHSPRTLGEAWGGTVTQQGRDL